MRCRHATDFEFESGVATSAVSRFESSAATEPLRHSSSRPIRRRPCVVPFFCTKSGTTPSELVRSPLDALRNMPRGPGRSRRCGRAVAWLMLESSEEWSDRCSMQWRRRCGEGCVDFLWNCSRTFPLMRGFKRRASHRRNCRTDTAPQRRWHTPPSTTSFQ